MITHRGGAENAEGRGLEMINLCELGVSAVNALLR